MTTSLSKILEGVSKTSEAVRLITEHGVGPERGPYSFSRLGSCPFKFKKHYIDREEGLKIGRFGTNVGSAQHELNELDVQMRIQRAPEDWLKIEDLIDYYLGEHPEYEEYAPELTEQLHLFRFNFKIHNEYYVASEQALGVDFGMGWTEYDAEDCWFRGKIDYLEINKHAGVARVVDFKNYPRVHSDNEINDIHTGVGCQLMGYVAMVMAMFPHVRAAFYEVYYTRFGTSRTSSLKNEFGFSEIRYVSRDEVLRWWRFNQRKMLAMERKTEFPPQPSQKECQFCGYLKKCPWFQASGEEEYIAATFDKAKEYASRLVVLKEEEKRLKHVLDEYTGSDDAITLESGEKYGYEEYEKTTIDPQIFLEVCKRAGYNPAHYVTINQTNASKLLKRLEDKDLKNLLKEAFVVEKKTRKVTPR